MEDLRQLLDYIDARERYIYTNNMIKAYYYYKYFITDVLPMLIKDCINNSSKCLDIKDIMQKPFDYKIHITEYFEPIVLFYKSLKVSYTSNVYYISFGDQLYYKFMEYLDAFCLRNGICTGINTSNAYIQSHTYNFDNMTFGDILNAYYSELQRFEYTDELIADIQEDENTNINEKELIRMLKS